MIRLRVSLRTLAILVTLTCAYFGAWEATKRYGVNIEPLKDPFSSLTDTRSPAAFIVSEDNSVYVGTRKNLRQRRTYYRWFFGLTFKTPFEAELP